MVTFYAVELSLALEYEDAGGDIFPAKKRCG
jgi:hypothetical protein